MLSKLKRLKEKLNIYKLLNNYKKMQNITKNKIKQRHVKILDRIKKLIKKLLL